MNNIIKMGLFTSSVVFTATIIVIAIGLFDISSTASMFNDVFAEIDNNHEEMKNSNIDISIDSISLKNSNEKCTWWDARGC
jgi:hypothetical protein